MLVRRTEDGALAVGQLSHAWLSGQLARAWGNAGFGEVEPREEIVLGAQQHDIGWALFDLDPGFNAESGLPRNFLELSVREHLAIWRGAPERLLSQSAHAAFVVSLHGRSLSELRARNVPDDAGALRAHIDEERDREAELRSALDISEEEASRTQRLMWTWDGLSLALCNEWRPFTAHAVPTADGLVDVELRDREDGTSTLEPWPLGSPRVRVRCEARRLAGGYETEAEMRTALRHAPVLTLEFVLAAA